MLCKNCDTRNDDSARFCHGCGTPLTMQTTKIGTDSAMQVAPVCPACGGQNPMGARFCVYCATSLTGTPAAPVSAFAAAPLRTTRLAYAGAAAPPTVNVVTNVNTYAPPQIMGIESMRGGNLLVRAIWFFFIGWWLGLAWTIVAWLFNLTLIGLPVGAMMLNAIPTVMTLRPRRIARTYVSAPGISGAPEHPIALRALWFLLVGWWASLVWMLIAWAFASSLLLMPISFWMFNRVPTITTLAAE